MSLLPGRRKSSLRARRRRWRRGGGIQQLVWVPHDYHPGDETLGSKILTKGLKFGPTDPGVSTVTLERDPHSFAWLRDLRAVRGSEAADLGRELIAEWLEEFSGRPGKVTQPVLAAERVINWICHFPWYSAGSDVEFRENVFASMADETGRLMKAARTSLRGAPRGRVVKALIYAATCLPGHGKYLSPSLDLLEMDLEQNIFPDGGCAERSPGQQFQLLRDLVEIRTVLAGAIIDVPAEVSAAIRRMAPLVTMMRHGDGSLAHFNGTVADDPGFTDIILNEAPPSPSLVTSAPDWGFYRLSSEHTTVLVDSGPAPETGFDQGAHAGTLSFEMSIEDMKVIVNSGTARGQDGQWREATRQTAAHSTLVLADTNSSEVLANRGLGRRPRHVTADLVRAQGVAWLDLCHDGYLERHRLLHRRRLSLGPDGRGLFGEDRLEPQTRRSKSAAGRPYVIRFHLHPSISIGGMQSNNGAESPSVVLQLPSGEPVILNADGAGSLTLEESIYMGRQVLRPSRQVVLKGETLPDGRAHIMWSITPGADDRGG